MLLYSTSDVENRLGRISSENFVIITCKPPWWTESHLQMNNTTTGHIMTVVEITN